MGKRTERWQQLNHRRRTGNRGRRLSLLLGVILLASYGLHWIGQHHSLHPFASGKAKPQDIQVVDENYEKLQHERRKNRDLIDRIGRAIQLLDEGRLAGAEKVLKGEEE